MASFTEAAMNKSEDATAQIARLREQVESLMKDRVTPAVAEAGRPGRVRHLRRGGHGARSGRGGFQQGARTTAAGDPDSGRYRLRARPGDPLIDADPPPGPHRGGGGGPAPATASAAHRDPRRCGIVALGFLAGAVVFAHLAAWFWLRLHWESLHAALIVAGADLVLAILLALLAARSAPSRVELEALAVRQRAIDSATSTLAFSALAMQLLRVLPNLVSRSRARASPTVGRLPLTHPLPDAGLLVEPVLLQPAEVAAGDDADQRRHRPPPAHAGTRRRASVAARESLCAAAAGSAGSWSSPAAAAWRILPLAHDAHRVTAGEDAHQFALAVGDQHGAHLALDACACRPPAPSRSAAG